MKIAVCIKQVPTREWQPRLRDDKTWIRGQDVSYEMNEPDAYALEEALRIKDRDPQTQVLVVSIGEERGQSALRSCLAMGADRALLVRDDALRDSDPLGTARALVAALKGEKFDLLLFGKQGVGTDHGQVGILVAEMLGLPHAGVVVKLTLEGGEGRAEREIEGAHEHMAFKVPAVVAAQKGLNEPRYASLKGIMGAKKKTIDIKDCAALGLDPATVGARGARSRIKKLQLPPARKGVRKIEGDPEAQVRELLRLLREEAQAL